MTNNAQEDAVKNQELKMAEKLKKIKNKILVLSGKGGVGKSTAAASIAYALSLCGKKTGILDIDLHGPSIPAMFGVTDEKTVYVTDSCILPVKCGENLWAVSVQFFLNNANAPLIWRGPMKISAIRQFIGDIEWDELDYLIIDSPPGTGDEPLTIAQDIKDIKVIILTTPQEISLSDVRKSIEFCRQLNIPILGVVENMSYLTCPECSKKIEIFKGGGADELSSKYNLDILGKIPLFEDIGEYFDKGKIRKLINNQNHPYSKIISSIVKKIKNTKEKGGKGMRVALALLEDKGMKSLISDHFGQCENFMIAEVENGKILKFSTVKNSAVHGGGGCLAVDEALKHNINFLIAGGMGGGAKMKFQDAGVEVFSFRGTAQDALNAFFEKNLKGIDACAEHGGEC